MRTIDFYKNWFDKIKEPKDIKPKGYEKQTEFDINFLKRYARTNKILLDLGAGTGATINELTNDFKKIIAIEKFEEFSKFIDNKIEVLNLDLNEIEVLPKADIVTAFGVFNHFDEQQVKNIYKKVFTSLSEGGIFIVKHAMGLKNDVFYETDKYWAVYRKLTREIDFFIESGFSLLKVENIYNDLYKNEKTNYFAIVGRKNG
jgi:cyclopropane fatty-acyl-phospholipid synthase-like methyltransferase